MTTLHLTLLKPTVRNIKRVAKQIVNTHANAVNQQFAKSTSHYQDLGERLTQALTDAYVNRVINMAKPNYLSRYSHITNFNQLRLARTLRCKISLIDIDVTLQRMLDVNHAANIIANFQELLVMPICVYEDANRPGRFVCWDGQHTAIVLYIIACQILGQNPDDVEVPIVVYESGLKADMRNNFIQLNGDAKKSLDEIDIFHQQVFGVRTDGATYSSWILSERKQQALEANGMFATHSKFNDTDQPGALSNMTEFVKEDLELVQAFCKYFAAVCNSDRPVESKEPWMLLMYFEHARSQGIKLTDEYVEAIADALNAGFSSGFDPDQLYNRAQKSYEDWWKIYKPNPDGTLMGIKRHRKNDTVCFMIAQITKYLDPQFAVPHTFTKYNSWTVPASDLF